MSEANFAHPRGDTFEYAGATVELVDASTILAAARVNPVDLVRRADWPEPVRRVEVTVSSVDAAGGPAHVFVARVHAGAAPMTTERMRRIVLGRDPIGLLLSRRIAEGDPVATRIVDGVGTAAAAAYRKLGLDRAGGPAAHRGPAVLADAGVGLQAEVGYEADGDVVRLRAQVPRDEVTPNHLRAFVTLTLQAVAELAGADALR
ncbi:hypothetical protein FHX34_1031, partial [Actinoplanes teichomyceticus]